MALKESYLYSFIRSFLKSATGGEYSAETASDGMGTVVLGNRKQTVYADGTSERRVTFEVHLFSDDTDENRARVLGVYSAIGEKMKNSPIISDLKGNTAYFKEKTGAREIRLHPGGLAEYSAEYEIRYTKESE